MTLVLTPLRVERWALAALAPVRTGAGPARSARAAARLRRTGRPVLVAGLCGALAPELEAGDVVVADEVRGGPGPVRTADPAELAAGLRGLGLRVHVGPVVSVDAPVDGARRAALARAEPSALAVDTESAWLAAAGDPAAPVQVVRVVVDTPARPLLRPGTAVRGVRALRVLRRAAPVLGAWSPTAAPNLPEEVN